MLPCSLLGVNPNSNFFMGVSSSPSMSTRESVGVSVELSIFSVTSEGQKPHNGTNLVTLSVTLEGQNEGFFNNNNTAAYIVHFQANDHCT